MTPRDFREVYEDPGRYWDFITQASDSEFEGHHFDRKQAGEADRNAAITKNKLRNVFELVEKTVSAFSNADGGLLVLGVNKTGEAKGIGHLNEEQRADLLHLDSMKGGLFDSKIFTAKSLDGQAVDIALFCVTAEKRDYCRRKSDGAAWIRKGPRSQRLDDVGVERLKRDRKIVDFELIHREAFEIRDIDPDVLQEFAKGESERSYDTSNEEVLRNAGALSGREGLREWTNAGLLFFASNPQRVLGQAAIRLLRFDCKLEAQDQRPTPTFDRTLTGPITKQIRDFRNFVTESGLFKIYQTRLPEGGFNEEPEYPYLALDEAIVNAVAHRDYGDRALTVCEKYQDAFVVRSPGRLVQDDSLPDSFRLADRRLEHYARNIKLVTWLRQMKDVHGAPYVKAIREGTRRMQDEMDRLGLPSPEFRITDSETILILRNDDERRSARLTGLADRSVDSAEFTNLYRLTGLDRSGSPEDSRESRRALIATLCDKLEASGWAIDQISKGRAVAHRRGAFFPTTETLNRVLRIIPAFAFCVRSYFGRDFLIVDYKILVQSVLTAQRAIEQFDIAAVLNRKAFAVIDGRLVRGRVVACDQVDATLRLFDSDAEETLPTNKVYPNLLREHIDALVRRTAPDFDLPKTIKKAALSMERGAARTRANRIETIISELIRDVFPLSVGGDPVSLDADPLRLLSDGDGLRALRVAQIKEPDVEFRRQHATDNIREGITSFGAYDTDPRDVEVVAVVQSGFENQMRSLIGRLQAGKFKFRGSERTFATRLQCPIVASVPIGQVEAECARLLEQYPDWVGNPGTNRLLLVHTPEEGFTLDDVLSPYYRIKRRLLEAGIPCQMVDTPTLNNPDYKDLNLALNIVAKTGLTPWVLPDSIPDADFFIGLSYTSSRREGDERLLGFANVFNHYGRWEFYSGGNAAVRYADRQGHYEELVAATLSKLNLPDRPTIPFHYSARFSRIDREAILRGARRICPHGRYVFVWINTHHPVRLFDDRPETDGSVARGRYVIGAGNQIYLSTTGYNPYRKTLGTPHVLEVNAYVNHPPGERPGPVDHRSLARQVLSLTKLNWASTDSLCAEPITTKYAKDIAYLTAAFQAQRRGPFKLHPVLEKTPWFI